MSEKLSSVRPVYRLLESLDAEFGATLVGGFLVTTTLRDEREIDVDDRAAVVEFVIEMVGTGGWRLMATNIVVTLLYDFDSVNISVGGQRHGPLEIIRGESLRPGEHLRQRVSVTTGIFSGAPRGAALPADTLPPSATPGDHPIRVEIRYDLVQDPSVDNVAVHAAVLRVALD